MVKTQLECLGFLPSDKKSLFHPTELSLSLSTLEGLTPISNTSVSLYPCPSHSVFRIHINKLLHPPRNPSILPVAQSRPKFLHVSGCVSWIPETHQLLGCTDPQIPPYPAVSRHPELDFTLFSGVSPFYQDLGGMHISPCISEKTADRVLDALALARPPPPWNAPEILKDDLSGRAVPDAFQYTLGSHDGLARLDHDRFNKRCAGAVDDMVNMLVNKRPKREGLPAPAGRTSATLLAKSPNPFAKPIGSRFPKGKPTKSTNHRRPSPHADPYKMTGISSKSWQLKSSRPVPDGKLLKPITALEAPVLPKEHFPRPIKLLRPTSKTKTDVVLKQTKLSFP